MLRIMINQGSSKIASKSYRANHRRGSVLLVAAGLASLMLIMFGVIVRQISSESQSGADVVADAQARIMLPAALSFLSESARLGSHVDGETFGWTDVRPYMYTGGYDAAGVPNDLGHVSVRGPMTRDGTFATTDGNVAGANEWPLPGSVYRADCFAWERPPMAVRSVAAPIPMSLPQEWIDEYYAAETQAEKENTVIWWILNPKKASHGETDLSGVPDEAKPFASLTCPHSPLGLTEAPPNKDGRVLCYFRHAGRYNDGYDFNHALPALNSWGMWTQWNRVWGEVLARATAGAPSIGNLNPQPVADTFDEFRDGSVISPTDDTPVARAGTTGRAWFRLYRETAADHDGNGSPFYDTSAMSGHNMFIVTVGAGASRGFASWDEVPATQKSRLFGNSQEFFRDIRSRERIMWFRVEWSGFIGGAADQSRRYLRHSSYAVKGNRSIEDFRDIVTNILLQQPTQQPQTGDNVYSFNMSDLKNRPVPMNQFGTIRRIERLEREPPAW